MLVIYIFILMFTNSINHLQKNIHSTFINRITIITLLISILFTFNTLYFQSIGKGISIYSGLFQITVQSNIVEILLLIVGLSILLGWPFVWMNLTMRLATLPQPPKGEGDRDKGGSTGLSPVYLSLLWPGRRAGKTDADKRGAEDQRGGKLSCALNIRKSDQYSLIAIFSILGGSLLMSSLDLLSMYLSIELQSFALYILATLNKERLSATSAGLKYFLLGSLSSCFILLGSAIIYSYTGLTQFEAINTLMSIPSTAYFNQGDVEQVGIAYSTQNKAGTGWIEMWELNNASASHPISPLAYLAWPYKEGLEKALTIGLVIIIIGFLFKISAAPFYQWAPDVYDGTPTIVTVWLTIIVKLTILIFLLGFLELTLPAMPSLWPGLASMFSEEVGWGQAPAFVSLMAGLASPHQTLYGYPFWDGTGWGGEKIKNLLLISSLLSLLIGTIVGLSQIKVKRLLAFSSISHVGFLLLALGIFTQKSIDSFIFYLLQYSLTSLNIFLILLAFGYLLTNSKYITALPIQLPQGRGLGQDQQKREGVGTDATLLKGYAQHGKGKTASTVEVKEQGYGPKAIDQAEASTGDEAVNTDINYLIELKGQLYNNPLLSVSLAICLFSMAGIPPLIGFFSKQFVLFSAIENGNNFLSIVAILVSVISASYYLRLIKITFFDSLNYLKPTLPHPALPLLKTHNIVGLLNPYPSKEEEGNGCLSRGGAGLGSLYTPLPGKGLTLAFTKAAEEVVRKEVNEQFGATALEAQREGLDKTLVHAQEVELSVTNLHSYIISILTFIILFFFLDPSIILNGTQLISLTIFNL